MSSNVVSISSDRNNVVSLSFSALGRMIDIRKYEQDWNFAVVYQSCPNLYEYFNVFLPGTLIIIRDWASNYYNSGDGPLLYDLDPQHSYAISGYMNEFKTV